MSEIKKNENFASTYKDLKVFQKAYVLSLDIHKTSLTFPKIEQYAMADQIRRASKSICANIAEGFGKQGASKAEFRRFIMVAVGSADEMTVWLQYCIDLDYIPQQTGRVWQEEYAQVARMLQALARSVDNR